MIRNINVVLASASPRRKELLKLLFEDFQINPANIDETVSADISPFEVAENIAVKKSQAIKDENSLIIACDTVVIIEGKILGKPQNSNIAFKMLSQLSGKCHEVVTGVCLCYKGKTYSFSEITEVEFYGLSTEEIATYIATGEPFDKAGGYGIQGFGATLVKGIKGDFYNVVGLPISRLKHEISRFLSIFDLT